MLVVVIVAKEVLFRRALAVGEAIDSTVVKVDAWHHRSDAITSAAAFVGIAAALVGGPRWAVADSYAALAGAAIIATNGARLVDHAVGDLMDRAPGVEVLEQIRQGALAVEGVLGIEKVLARRFGMGYRIVLHVEADPAMSLYDAHPRWAGSPRAQDAAAVRRGRGCSHGAESDTARGTSPVTAARHLKGDSGSLQAIFSRAAIR